MTAHYFICGIGGSGMLPLAVILKGLGYTVLGSDRSYDQGRTPEKFEWIAKQGIALYPQDGSGVRQGVDRVVISKAVEAEIPDLVIAEQQGIPVAKRVDVLIELFNSANLKIAISGTSGKTTTTGMTGFLLKEAGLAPTVMNGGIFRNYAADNPYATAFVGDGGIFVSEIDESDGAEAVCRFRPDIAVIHNISLDHQPMDELKAMFSGFLGNSRAALLNGDDNGVMAMAGSFTGRTVTYGLNNPSAEIRAEGITLHAGGVDAIIHAGGSTSPLHLQLPGRHNVSNALAAIAAGIEAGLGLAQCTDILGRFEGIKRRMEIVGKHGDILVMDDFAHNPDKVAASLGTLKAFPGRLHVFFQPHGFGFLKLLWRELAQTFAHYMGPEDRLYLVEPYYAGGTVDRSIGAAHLAAEIERLGGTVFLEDGRDGVKARILDTVKPGDRIVVMGARDDTLSGFAASILLSIQGG